MIELLAVFGLSNRSLGLALGLSKHTVGKIIVCVMDKLGCHTRLEIIKWRYHNEP